MIKFSTDVVRKNEKLLKSLVDRDDLYSSNFYLDFDNKVIQFKSGVTKDGQEFYGHLKVPFEVEGDVKSFNVDAMTFLHICSTYEELSIKEKVFYSGKEKIKLKILDEIEHNEPVSFGEFNWDNSKELSFVALRVLDKSSKFVGERFPAVNIDTIGDDSYAAATDIGIYFESKVEGSLEKAQLSDSIIKIFKDSSSQEVRYNMDGNLYYINVGDNLEMVTSMPSFSELPFASDDFRERFSVPKLFSFKNEELADIIKFFKPFFADVFQKIIQISFVKGRMVLTPLLQDYEVSKSLKVEYPEAIEGKSLNLSLDYVEKFLSSIEEEEIDFNAYEDFEEDKKDFCVLNGTGNDKEKILCKFILT